MSDKLKPIYIVEGYEQDPNLGKFTRPTILRYDILAYRKDDVDAAIDNLKARINELENTPHTDNSAVIDLLQKENAKLIECVKNAKDVLNAAGPIVLGNDDSCIITQGVASAMNWCERLLKEHENLHKKTETSK